MTIGSFFSKEQALQDQLAGALAREKQLAEKVTHYEQHISWLHEQLRTLNRARFGKKSEAWES